MRALALALALLAGEAAAEGPRMLPPDEAEAYRAVGRLNVAGARFCTATLVSERLALTAAHCLVHPRTGRAVPLSELRFVPGLRIEEEAGVLRVARAATAPGFTLMDEPRPEDLDDDIALLELEGSAAVVPLEVAGLSEERALSIVSYGRRRAHAPSISERCPPLERLGAVLVVGCEVEEGVSGAPVLAGGRVVAVVSAMGRLPLGRTFALTVTAAPWMEVLRARLAASEGTEGLDVPRSDSQIPVRPEPPGGPDG